MYSTESLPTSCTSPVPPVCTLHQTTQSLHLQSVLRQLSFHSPVPLDTSPITILHLYGTIPASLLQTPCTSPTALLAPLLHLPCTSPVPASFLHQATVCTFSKFTAPLLYFLPYPSLLQHLSCTYSRGRFVNFQNITIGFSAKNEGLNTTIELQS